jgi:hypothetical protein
VFSQNDPCDCHVEQIGDLDDNGEVGGGDLAIMLAEWGTCD